MLDVQVRGLAREVAAEEQARRDPTPLQKTDEFASSEGGAGADGDDEPEPTRVAQRRGRRQEQKLLVPPEGLSKAAPIALPGLDEVRQLRELSDTHRGLHVGELQVVPDMRIDELVIVPAWKLTELPIVAFPAGVLLSGVAPAISAPVTERLHEHLERRLVGDDAPPLAHRDMVGWVKAKCR